MQTLSSGALTAKTTIAPTSILAALASPVRLRMLMALSKPRIVTELRIPADRGQGSIAARQTVQAHLHKLMEAGLVVTVDTVRNGRPCRGYVARAETVRAAKLALRRVADDLDSRGRADDGTLLFETIGSPQDAHLIVVQGADHVATFELPPANADRPARQWVIGRDASCDLHLSDDAFVSRKHAYIESCSGEYAVRDAMSANGTALNGVKLAPGARALLRSGDLLGLGRSFLIFREKVPAAEPVVR